MTKRPVLYALLLLVFLIASAYQGRFIQRRVAFLARPSEQVQLPLDLKFASNEILSVSSAAGQAGLQKGERLLAVDGQPYTGNTQLADAVFGKQPGDQITLTIAPPSSDGAPQAKTVTVDLSPISGERYPDVLSWIFVIFLTLLLPVFCMLVGFTDGISEAMNLADEEWGEEELIEALKACYGLSASETIARLVNAADAFAAGAKQHDDMTVVIVRVV